MIVLFNFSKCNDLFVQKNAQLLIHSKYENLLGLFHTFPTNMVHGTKGAKHGNIMNRDMVADDRFDVMMTVVTTVPLL